jgi:hypothetical protein
MHTAERDVVGRRDRNRIRDFAGGEPEEFPCARGRGDRELSGVVEALRHHRDDGCKSALDFVRYGEGQHEFLAGPACLLGRGEDGPEIVARMTEAAGRHVAVEKIDITHETGVEERCLIRGGLAAANQCAATRGTVFLELFAQRPEGWTRQRRDRAAEAVQDIALEKPPDVGRQMLRPRRSGKDGDAFNR